jgi:hypothetical protein
MSMNSLKKFDILIRPWHVATLILSFLALCAPALAADVTLAWDANTESDLAGYKLYYGTSPGVYGTPITLGKVTTYALTNLPDGTYYIAVTAYNTGGLESGYSNVVTATLSGTPATSKCDLNSDSTVNVLDLQLMINVILGSQTLPGKGDLNADGRVDVLDLQILGNVILGLRTCPL